MNPMSDFCILTTKPPLIDKSSKVWRESRSNLLCFTRETTCCVVISY